MVTGAVVEHAQVLYFSIVECLSSTKMVIGVIWITCSVAIIDGRGRVRVDILRYDEA